jgi:uncharacterized membrane protein required for colicin V production
MSPQLPPSTGSPFWQLVFVSFAVVLIFFEIVRGWRRGIARQLARLGALIAAYFAAFYVGRFAVPLLRPFLRMPDPILSILAGAVLALFLYALISGFGTMLFKRTSQHDSVLLRFFYGSSGAVLGIFFGAFLVWLVVVGVRSLGAVAEAAVQQEMSEQNTAVVHAVDLRRRVSAPNQESPTLMMSLARLKNSLELGVVGDAVKKADVVPAKAYETLGKVGQVASSAESAQRLLDFPGARQLSENPRVVALRNDPEIAALIAQGHFVDLLQNQKIRDAANDPELVKKIKQFDLQRALDYALRKE